ncbi:sorbosone dehydrogenase family protein [Leptolyngbya sp. 15MV]|nr:sorbosone dehydrogenase family protein [Leptolyngbya sp. 15MV]
MSIGRKILVGLLVLVLVLLGFAAWVWQGHTAELSLAEVTGTDPVLGDPRGEMFPTVRIAKPIGWSDGEVPEAAEGLAVTRFADGLDHPRVLHALPNGDVLVPPPRAPGSEGGGITAWIANLLMTRAGAKGPSANQLVLLRDTTGDGVADTRAVLSDALDSPSGIAWNDGTLYIANHDAVMAFPYVPGETRLGGPGRKLMDLPAAGNHWMRNIELSPDGTSLYIAVGSDSNIGEKGIEAEDGRAMIWELDLATGEARPFAAGLRNPNGLDWNPWSGELWTTVNERDMLGSDLVPDYLTNVPVGAQYGWPWLYWRENIDDRVKAPMPQYLMEYTRRPEYALGPHVAALGLVFSKEGDRMGERFGQGAFIAQHGSWNRKPPSGYDVVYVAFDALGNPQGRPVPVLTGFLTGDGTTRGRPTWVEWAGDGALLVSDDTAGIIWRVIAPQAEARGAIVRAESRSLPPRRELSGSATASFREDEGAR